MGRESEFFNNPRTALKASLLVLLVIWQTLPTCLGFGYYLLFMRQLKVSWRNMLTAGVILASIAAVMLYHSYHYKNPYEILQLGFYINAHFWTLLLTKGFAALLYIFDEGYVYLWAIPPLVAAAMGIIDLIPSTPYEEELQAIRKAEEVLTKSIGNKKLNKALQSMNDADYNGTLLGISKHSGEAVVLPDEYVNQVVLVFGTTGGGKTITLRRFYRRAILQKYPLIIVDGKPSDENVEWLEVQAKQSGRKFYGFNCGECCHYNPLAQGDRTELKDKIICLKDEWESDYYRSIAEDYLQTIFEVLIAYGQPIDLPLVVSCLSSDMLHGIVMRGIQDKNLQANLLTKLDRLAVYDSKEITGLRAHLNILVASELGQYFELTKEKKTIALQNIIDEGAIAYFALPALRYPSFAQVLGKLVINDIKSVIDRQSQQRKIFTIFDEFSVFASEQVLNLVNMGRGKGVYSVFGMQGISDLKKGGELENKILNCANTIICHRLNDALSAETIATWVGTQTAFDVTAQIHQDIGTTGLGTVRKNKSFIVHPDDIKQSLQVGEAFYITKVNKFAFDKIKIKR